MTSPGLLVWKYRGIPYFSNVVGTCPTCGANAIIALTGQALEEQPDDTTHVCHPLVGGCNGGFALDADPT